MLNRKIKRVEVNDELRITLDESDHRRTTFTLYVNVMGEWVAKATRTMEHPDANKHLQLVHRAKQALRKANRHQFPVESGIKYEYGLNVDR
ncbi:hypothetical protein [Alicyclobacillus dauci]|uniref:Uncharacterized protein n=1 Tax=Alicyclobacillus dauci TaxID=1475485 RepID=A0ABY6Z9J0_9BACL|nr:hypothetical protein [Alicyclobacillus dauci]WAH39529.1 hypothetical protein NZD86_23870 [Alicyclobacillus dauci]